MDKEKTKDLLNRIVLSMYEQKVEVKDEWAKLESVERVQLTITTVLP
jgi:hypothetical protein